MAVKASVAVTGSKRGEEEERLGLSLKGVSGRKRGDEVGRQWLSSGP